MNSNRQPAFSRHRASSSVGQLWQSEGQQIMSLQEQTRCLTTMQQAHGHCRDSSPA